MRWLAPIVLVLLTRVALAAPGLVELPGVRDLVVVAISDEPDDARHVIEGKVTRIKPLGDNVARITVGRGAAKGSFQIGLPPRFKLPVRIGDQIRAELWVDGTMLHARVTDGKGASLVLMNELPPGWTLAVGADTGDDYWHPRRRHLVELTAPGGVTRTFERWVRGPIDGVTYRIYAEAATINVKAAEAKGWKVTWTESIFSGVVRER